MSHNGFVTVLPNSNTKRSCIVEVEICVAEETFPEESDIAGERLDINIIILQIFTVRFTGR